MLSTTRINEIIGIKESFQLPERMLQILGNPEERKRIFSEFLSYENDLSFDWFTDYFQEQHSNRENMMQDFTPKALTELLPVWEMRNVQQFTILKNGRILFQRQKRRKKMKHNLSQYHRGDSIIVVDKDGKEYQGVITLFTPAKDNEVDEDAIAIDSGYWFDESDIQSIKLRE